MLSTFTVEITNFILLNVYIVIFLIVAKEYLRNREKSLLMLGAGFLVSVISPAILQLFTKGMWYPAKDPVFVNIQTIFAIIMLVGVIQLARSHKSGRL